jgi:lactate racemase
MAKIVEFPWGDDTLDIHLPPSWTLLGELSPRTSAAPADASDACAGALRDPIGARPLDTRDLSKAKVVIVVDDHSRPTPVSEFVQPVLDQLDRAGAADDRVEFLLATGVHRSSSREEVERKLGAEIAARYRWRCHDAHDRGGLTDVGVTARGTRVLLNKLLLQADLIVCLGALEPHLLLGFGGGLKMLVPGCAGAETIGTNHMQGVDPEHFDYVGEEVSPMRLDLEQAAQLPGKEIFIVNAAMNERGELTHFFCGDPVAAHRRGVAHLREHVRMEVPEAADVALANSYPMDNDLRQSIKCVGNALYAARPGGVLLGCVRCEQGMGEIAVPKQTLPYPLLRTLVRVIGGRRVLPLVERIKRGEPVEEVFVSHFGLQMLRRNHLGLFSRRLPADTGKKMGMACTFNRVQAMIDWAARRTPRRATVWAFPFGGSTFAEVARR